jgi:hypothetical protein
VARSSLKPRSDTAPLLWLGLVLSITLAIAFLLPVTPQDYWWYLRLGRDTLAAGAVPQIDTFSTTRAGSPVVYFSWGAAVLFWLIHQIGGLTLTVLVRGLLVSLAGFLTWYTARHLGAGRIGAALMLLLAVLASSSNWSVRPQLFAYPLFTLAVFILYRWNEGAKKVVYWLPLIGLVWVNLHGSFVMLILLSGAALVFGRGARRPLALAAAGVLLATLLNPHGSGSWTYVFNSLTAASSQQFSVEWRPPLNLGWQMHIFFLWLLAFPLLAAFSPRKPDRLEWAWFLGFGFLALWGERYGIWFVFLLAVFTARMLADFEKKLLGDPKPGSPRLNLVLSLAFILLPLALLPGLRSAWWSQAPAETENTPVAATQWLASHPGLPGPLWSEIGFSSYLEFALPERPVWIDTRFEVFPVEQWQQYRDISNAAWNWSSQLSRTGANLVMISVAEQPGLIQALSGQALWCEIYRDDVAVIYQRRPGSQPGLCGGG